MTKKVTKKTASKKTTPKKAAKKAIAKKATPKVTKPKKPTPKAKTKTSIGTIKMLSAKSTAGKQTRRPPNNPPVPGNVIQALYGSLDEIKITLDEFSQHLRALDRKRLNGVGIRKLGFIERAYELALENPEFLPHYLTIERFGDDINYFLAFRSLLDVCRQIEEKFWNIVIQSADIAYTDALEFYASVREAAKRRVDAAETLHNDLKTFFEKMGSRPSEEPTEKKIMRDAHSLIRGKKDGIIEIENIKPKLTGGKRKLIDETYKNTARFKEMENGEIDE